MTLMLWDETMSVGVPELDSQHQALIALINDAYEAIRKHDEHLMTTLLDQMREYAVMHFHFEEEYMQQNGYPDLASHRELHDGFNDKVDEFQQQLHSRTNFSQVFVFLSRWLTAHIMKEDMRYTKYMAQKAAGGEPA
jgi:hemerythrin